MKKLILFLLIISFFIAGCSQEPEISEERKHDLQLLESALPDIEIFKNFV